MGAHPHEGKTVELAEGPFQGSKAKVLQVGVKSVKVLVELFHSTIEVTVPHEAVGLEAPASRRPEDARPKDKYHYIEENLESIKEQAYKFQCFPEYDLDIVPGFIWFRGFDNSAEVRSHLRTYFVVNLVVVQLPLLCVTRSMLSRMNDGNYHERVALSGSFEKPSRRNLFRQKNIDNYYWCVTHEFDPLEFLKHSEAPGPNERLEGFLNGDVIPATLEFIPVPKVSRNFMVCPLIPHEDYMKETLMISGWGLFEDKMELLLPAMP